MEKQHKVSAWSKYFLIIYAVFYFACISSISLGQDQPPPRHKHSIKEMVTKIKKLNPFKKTKDGNAGDANYMAKKKGRKSGKPSVDSKGRATQPII